MAMQCSVSLSLPLGEHAHAEALAQAFRSFCAGEDENASKLTALAKQHFSPQLAQALTQAVRSGLLEDLDSARWAEDDRTLHMFFDTHDAEYEAFPAILSALGRCGFTDLSAEVQTEELVDDDGVEHKMLLTVDQEGEVDEQYERLERLDEWSEMLPTYAKNDNVEDVLECLANGASPTRYVERLGASALGFACEHARPRMVKLLLEHGADPNHAEPLRGVADQTPCCMLMHAAWHRNNRDPDTQAEDAIKCVQALLDAGALPDWEANNGARPIHLAQEPEILQILLDRGAKPGLPTSAAGLDLLIECLPQPGIRRGAETFRFWLEQGLDPNASGPWCGMRAPLLIKVISMEQELRHLLALEQLRADVVSPHDGLTAIEELSRDKRIEPENKVELMKLMIARGAKWDGPLPDAQEQSSE